MTVKTAIKKELQNILQSPEETPDDITAKEQRCDALKEIAKNLLTVKDFSEVFGDLLISVD